MKRRDLLRELVAQGCVFVREGGSHEVWRNPRTNRNIIVPRHVEINALTASKILKEASR